MEEDEVKQRTMLRCPRVCDKFRCVSEEDCREYCDEERMEFAKAIICDLCVKQDECTETQRKLFLDIKYYQDRIDKLTKSAFENIIELKKDHEFLEKKITDLRKKNLETPNWKFWKKQEISKEGHKAVFELRIMRESMDKLNINYKKNVEI